MSFANTSMLQELMRLCRIGENGTMFTALTDGHQLRIGLLRGRIVHISSLTLRGLAALKTLPSRAPKSFRFQNGLAPEPHSDLPTTPAVLAFLSDGLQEASAPTAEHELPRANNLRLDSVALLILTEEFAEYIGPIAELLVKEAQKESQTAEGLLDRLSAQLESVEESATFVSRVRARLG